MKTKAAERGSELLRVLKVIRAAKTAPRDQIERMADDIEQAEKDASRQSADRPPPPSRRHR
jgi:hypothetical protein